MRKITVFFTALVLLAAGCGLSNNKKASMVMDKSGVIKIEKEGMKAGLTLKKSTLDVVLSYPTSGWAAIGFRKEKAHGMEHANIIIGYVKGKEVVLSDQWGTGFKTHKPDKEIGGKYDITGISGSEKDGITTMAFTIPLDSGDGYDVKISRGDMVEILMAYGKHDALKGYHSKRTHFNLQM